MSRETLVKDADGTTYSLDNLSTQKWLEGHYAGLDHCCRWLDEKATVLFSQRKRDDAVGLQELADQLKRELRPVLVKQADQHKKEFPSEVQQ